MNFFSLNLKKTPVMDTFQEIEIKKQQIIDDEYNLIKGNFSKICK